MGGASSVVSRRPEMLTFPRYIHDSGPLVRPFRMSMSTASILNCRAGQVKGRHLMIDSRRTSRQMTLDSLACATDS